MNVNPSIVSLIIGRGNNTLPDKNILPVFGQPLLHYTAAAARKSKYIGRFYASSDCPKILEAAKKAGYESISRPMNLALPTSQSPDVVKHALDVIEQSGTVDILVVQHANAGTIKTEWIDSCIEILLLDPSLSSVIPAHEASEYHPFRAKKLKPDGLLEPFFDFPDNRVSANRQDLPKCYFFDHSIWVLKVENSIKSANGQPPWNCMGNRIKPFVTQGAFDVHTVDDLRRTEQWILENNIPIPNYE